MTEGVGNHPLHQPTNDFTSGGLLGVIVHPIKAHHYVQHLYADLPAGCKTPHSVCKLSKWQPVVSHLIAKHAPYADGKPIDAEAVIHYLNKKIKLHLKVYSDFKADIPCWRASIHCKTIIATLLYLLANHPHCGFCVKELLKVYMWSHFC
jgi:hypothetical protein